jgi:Flp pilus assembly protein TadD
VSSAGSWALLAAVWLGESFQVFGEPVSFNKDIAPIVFRSCAPCHRPAGTAPFSLLRYEDLSKHAAQIVAVTASRYMPPWLPDPGSFRFADEARLTAAEIGLFERWVKDGRVEGKAADLPAAPRFGAGWQLGEPDLILEAPRAFVLQAEGPDVYRNFVFAAGFSGTRYVRAVEIRPGASGVVHHANLLLDGSRAVRRRDGSDGQPGFSGMDVEIPASLTDPESHFLFWKSGSVAASEPEGMAWTLNGQSDLVLNMHLKPGGKPEPVQPSIGLYFTPDAPHYLPLLVQLENDRALDIPAGDNHFVVSDTFTVPIDCDLPGIYPHAHYLGKDALATAIFPDGTERTLLHIPRWDGAWQAVYRYDKPVFLPRGTRILMRWTYDNSAANTTNPSRPPKRVTGGNQTTDEMAHLWLQLLPRGGGDRRIVIQEALTRDKLKREPDDFTAHFNLAGILRARQDREGTVRELREAIRIRPRDEVALNALGASLQLQDKKTEAEALYRRALESSQAYPEAHYNLAGLLLARGDRLAGDEAIAHLHEVLRLAHDDPQAREKLAGALEARAAMLAGTGALRDATRDLRDVVTLRPADSDAWANLGVALARQGDFVEAREALVHALRINPNSDAASRTLDRVEQRLR